MMVPLISKFPGRCKVCKKSVRVGDEVWWGKGEGVIHRGCSNGEWNPSWKAPYNPWKSIPVCPDCGGPVTRHLIDCPAVADEGETYCGECGAPITQDGVAMEEGSGVREDGTPVCGRCSEKDFPF